MSRPSIIAAALVLSFGAGCGAILGIPGEVTPAPEDGGLDSSPLTPEAGPDGPGVDGGLDAANDADGEVPPDVDSGPQCDPAKDFLAPTLITSISKNGSEGSSRLSDDEKTIYFAGQLNGAATFDMYSASRTVLTDSFANIAPIPGGANTTVHQEYQPNVTSDGLTLFFERQDGVSEDSNVFMASRSSIAVPFGAAVPVPGDVNGAGIRYDAKVFARGDGSRFFYSSLQSGSKTNIFQADKQGTDWIISAVPVINTVEYDEYSPVISKDELTMFFASDRPVPGGGMVGYNIWVAKRTAPELAFDEPTLVPAINSNQFDEPSWLSLDGCRLYLMSKRQLANESRQAIYVAKRPL